MKDEPKKRIIKGPDGFKIEVDPMEDYFCTEPPKAHPPIYVKIIEDLFNWARSESIKVLEFGTGCGAIEMRPLMTPRFDTSRLGVQWQATPSQANLLMISGCLSTKTLKRAICAYEQMQNPKYVVGLGSCSINGGTYWDSYNTIKKLDEYLPVDTYIAGCMPRPEALWAGFEDIKKIIRAGKAEGANKYAENFEWYKKNQKQVIKNWDMPDYNW